jgi:hypothetical protein
MELLSRQDAMLIGNHLYFTGKACKQGHIAPRYTKICACTECHRENNKRQMAKTTLAMQGVKVVWIRLHKDDVQKVTDAVDLMNMMRGLNVPQSPSPSIIRDGRTYTAQERQVLSGVPPATTGTSAATLAAIAATRAQFTGDVLPKPTPHIPSEFAAMGIDNTVN